MARRRKSSNDPLAFLITAFLMMPFVLAAIFKLLFKGISCLISFIGGCIERHQSKQQAYHTYNTSNSYRSQNTYNTNRNSDSSNYSNHSSNSTYKTNYNSSARTNRQYQPDSAYQNTEKRHSASDYHSNTGCASLYELLRIPGDSDPDFTMPSAPSSDSYEEYFDDSDNVSEEIQNIVLDEDEAIIRELENLDIDESDLTIMGLVLYDMLTNEDNN